MQPIGKKENMVTDSKPRILVVDDEPEILGEVASYLRRRGELVLTAASYKQAMAILNDDAAPIDLMITDARMPDGSGVDLLRWAINEPRGPRACVLMTGHLEEDDLADVLDQSGMAIVYKPFSLASFYREILSLRTARCSGEPAHKASPPATLPLN